MENISFQYKKKRFRLKVKLISNVVNEALGLSFTGKQKARALLFNLKKPLALHSYFVFFPFITIWLKDNKVVEIKKVKPFTLHIKPKKSFNKIIEIPINKRYKNIIKKLGL